MTNQISDIKTTWEANTLTSPSKIISDKSSTSTIIHIQNYSPRSLFIGLKFSKLQQQNLNKRSHMEGKMFNGNKFLRLEYFPQQNIWMM